MNRVLTITRWSSEKAADPWLTLPIFIWMVAYVGFLAVIVPEIRKGSRNISYAR